jgi:hypothetical protein
MDSAILVSGDKHPHGHHQDHKAEKGNMLIEGWKHHVEEMFGGAKNILPIMEGGEVKLLPFMEEEGEAGSRHRHGHGQYRHPGAQAQSQEGHHLRPHGGHHWRHRVSSFGSR